MPTIENQLLTECDQLLKLIRDSGLASPEKLKPEWSARMDAMLDIRNRIKPPEKTTP